MFDERVVHHAHDGIVTYCGWRHSQVEETTNDWDLVTCNECMIEHRLSRRRRWIWAVGIIVSVTVLGLMIALLSLASLTDGEDALALTDEQVAQTTVASSVQATLQSVQNTREYPTRQAVAATQTVAAATSIPQTRQARSVQQTKVALRSALATKTAPAPYSVRVQGREVVCREIAYEYVYMAELGKLAALQHVSNTIFIRLNDPSLYVSAHDAENALVDCQCFSPRNCKPLR